MIIKILGSGCKKCVTLTENTRTALANLGREAEVIKVTEISEIAAMGVMSTPALAIDDQVVAMGKVLSPAEVEALFDEISGTRMKPFFERYIRGTDDVPLARLLAPFGVKYSDARKGAKASLDVNLAADAKLAQVHEGGAAHIAGLSAGDVLVALDGLRVTGGNLDALLSRYAVGAQVAIHAFRRDELMTFTASLQGDRVPNVNFVIAPASKKLSAWKRPTAQVL